MHCIPARAGVEVNGEILNKAVSIRNKRNSQRLMKDKKLCSSSVLCKPRYNMHMVKQEKKIQSSH